ncbi:ABC transporter ATP-binding protein [Mesorhizobium sp. UC22_110]|uniref:ABC transporter ATP-binding protein n=1 Tax=unclassified Mesorhizobium TaxID=325217 RepID=UPI0036709A60
MTSPLVSIRNLSVSYERNATSLSLGNIDLEIATGERLAIIGESGSGKSTLALAIAGLLPPTAAVKGTILWSGQPQPPRGGHDIGFVFQDASASLDPVMAVGRQIAEVARTHLDLSRAQAQGRALDLLRRVRLPDPDTALHAYPHQLSGGQRQRVAIAAAIAAGPRLLIADEATSALDTIVQADIVALIRQLVVEDGMALLFVSHDIALAAELADRIAVFRNGEMVELGVADAVIQNPRHAYTRKLLDAHIGLDAAPMIVPTERGHV